MTDETFFPGRDYPDREEWLKRRSTPKREPRYIYTGQKPLALGINNAKRIADAQRFGGRTSIIRERHAFWRRRSANR